MDGPYSYGVGGAGRMAANLQSTQPHHYKGRIKGLDQGGFKVRQGRRAECSGQQRLAHRFMHHRVSEVPSLMLNA